MNTKRYIVLNTKGGVGKTTLATQIIPACFPDKQINLLLFSHFNMIDTDNFKPENMLIKQIPLGKYTKMLTDKYTDIEVEDSAVIHELFTKDNGRINIIDIGGGLDVKNTIEVLQRDRTLDFVDIEFIVPTTENVDVNKYNTLPTISEIKTMIPEAKIHIVLSFASSLEKQDYMREFWGLFGNVKHGFESLFPEIKPLISSVSRL